MSTNFTLFNTIIIKVSFKKYNWLPTKYPVKFESNL